jgi:diadenosine tetraphosphate (Ap4A) HIT family hydrolase
MMNNINCPHCQRVQLTAKGHLETLVHETDRVIVIAGDHQFFQGYCVVIAKSHIREMHHMPRSEAAGMFEDVLNVGRLIEAAYKPLKMNYVSLGNIDEHLHWHVMPRFIEDPDHKHHPWKNSEQFSSKPTTKTDIIRLRSIFTSN